MAFEPRILRPDESGEAESNQAAPHFDQPRAGQQHIGKLRSDAAAPKISRAHEAAEEWDLPDDLGELATQLAADAAMLETRYPATNRVASPASHVVSRLLRITAAAILMTGSVWWVAHRRSADRHGAEHQVAQQPDVEARQPTERPAVDPTAGPTAPATAPAAVVMAPPSVREAAGEAKFDRRGAFVTELSLDPEAAEADSHTTGPRDRIGMLEAQLSAFEKVIARLQAEVRRRDQLLAESGELIKSLTAEVESLRKQQAELGNATTAPVSIAPRVESAAH